MLYPVAIDKSDSALGVQVPDIPGCFSGGDNYQDALESVKEAIDAHLGLLVEDGEAIPHATTIEHWLAEPDYAGAVWALVDVDITVEYENAAPDFADEREDCELAQIVTERRNSPEIETSLDEL